MVGLPTKSQKVSVSFLGTSAFFCAQSQAPRVDGREEGGVVQFSFENSSQPCVDGLDIC